MASYIEQTLTDDERILYTGNISLWSLWHLIAMGAVLMLIGLVGIFRQLGAFSLLPVIIGFGNLTAAFVRYSSTEIAITNKRTIAKFGFIARSTIELNISHVESIQVEQTLMGRIFNFGTLILSGAGNPQEPIAGIAKPLAFRKAFAIAQENSVRLNPSAAA